MLHNLNYHCTLLSMMDTDIYDVFNFLKISKEFYGARRFIQKLTSKTIINTSVNKIIPFSSLIHIDHKIILNVDRNNLPLFHSLDHAHFNIVDINLLPSLLQSLPGLNRSQYYFKISLTIIDTTIGILISNGNFIIIPISNHYETMITEIIRSIGNTTNLIKTMPQYTRHIRPNIPEKDCKFLFWRTPLRNFLKFFDFGLMNSTLPSSENNLPLVNYISKSANGDIIYEVMSILKLGINYCNLSKIWPNLNESSIIFRCVGPKILEFFKEQIEQNLDYFNSETEINKALYFLIELNILDSITIEEIVEYEYPFYHGIDELSNVHYRAHLAYRTINSFRSDLELLRENGPKTILESIYGSNIINENSLPFYLTNGEKVIINHKDIRNMPFIRI